MSSNEICFDKLSQLIEHTEDIIKSKICSIDNIEELQTVTEKYFELYGFKSNIIKGITSTIEFKKLLKNKLNWLILLSNECNRIKENLHIPEVIKNDVDYLIFAKKCIIENRIKPTIDFVINEIELCLFENNNLELETIPVAIPASENTLNWKGTTLQFAELTKALIQANLINPELTEIERFNRMKLLFNVKEFKKSEKLKDIRERSKDLTPLINTLEISLTNWIKNKD